MKLKSRRRHTHRLSKFDLFAGRYMEHDINDDGQIQPSQVYPYQLLNGKANPIALSKYHLIKKFKEKKNDIVNYTHKKTTKQIKQLIKIYYFLSLAKKTYYLISTLKRATRALKIWVRQMIQNELYYLKKALELSKNKEQIRLIYIKYEIIKIKYKHIHINYLKNIIKTYMRKMKKIKKEWKRMLVTGFAQHLRQRNKIIPFIFYLRKILFKKIKNGTLRSIKYWKKLIKSFCRRHKIMKEYNIHSLINNDTKRNVIEENSITTETIKPYILLKYINILKKKSRPSLIKKIRKEYYSLLINIAKKIKLKKKKLLTKKKSIFKKLAILYALVTGKKRYMFRDSYMRRKMLAYISRFEQKELLKLHVTQLQKEVENKLFLNKVISVWFLLLKNWKRFKIFKAIRKIKIKKDQDQYKYKYKYKYKRRKRWLNYRMRRTIRRIVRHKKKKMSYLKLLRKILKTKKAKRYIRLQRSILKKKIKTQYRLKKLFRHKRINKIKKRRGRWYARKKIRNLWKRKIRRIAYRTPYVLTCRFYRDYTGSWVDFYKKRNKYNKHNRKRRADLILSRVMSRRNRRFLRKNYKYMNTSKYTLILKQKELFNVANNLFKPRMF